MDRRTSPLSLLVLLLSGSAAMGQVGAGAPLPPPPAAPPSVATAPSPGQPILQPAAPYGPPPGQPVYPPPPPPPPGQPGQPILQPAAPYGPPPGQPVYPPPSPYLLAPGQPVYPAPAPWMPAPSPGLGLVPGEDNPRWDINVDALWLERDAGKGVPLGSTSYTYGWHAAHGAPPDTLWSDDVVFPLQPGIRFQLIGRITDQMAIEGSAWGLQQWSIGRTIYADPTGNPVLAHSSWLQTPAFDNSLGYTYNSQVANVELNQRFKLLSYDPYRAFSWLWGVRYFHLSDDFTLSGSDLAPGNYENLNLQTQNNLIGMQLGAQWAWGWDRLELCAEAKIGLFANVYSQQGTDSASGTIGFPTSTASHSGTDLAALFEFSVLLRYRITPCMWMRAGYQFYGVSGLALGPRQVGGYDTDGAVGLDGLSVGLEFTR